MNLDNLLKKDVLGFLDSFVKISSKTDSAALDDTSFLLSKDSDKDESKHKSSEDELVIQAMDEEVSTDLDFFPSESSDASYEEPSALRTPTVDASKEISEQVLKNSNKVETTATNIVDRSSVSNINSVSSVPSQHSLDRTQIKLLVEQELKSKMSELKSAVPSQRTVMESSKREDLLRLKNEIIDLKSIVSELQKEKVFASEERSKLKDELTRTEIENKIAKRETKLAYAELISLKKNKSSIIPLIKFKEETQDKKEEPAKEEVQKNLGKREDQEVIQKTKEEQNQKIQLSEKELKPILIQEKSKTREEGEVKETERNLAPEYNSVLEHKSELEQNLVPKTKSEHKSKDKSVNKEKHIVSSRSQELPEVLILEEKLHHLKELLFDKNYSEAKDLYENIKLRAIKLKEHNDEKKVIYEQLQNSAKILSLALKGQITAMSKSKNQFVDTSNKPAVLMKKNEGGELNDESLEKYTLALEAMRRKEKAKSLKLLIGLLDKHPKHLGIKLRLQQALAL